MKKSILSLSLAFLGLGAVTTSCEDMLTPDMDRYATGFTGTDTVNFYLGILSNLQGMVEQNILLGELRGDLIAPTEYVSDSISSVASFSNLEDGESDLLNRAAYYKVINQCNYYLAKADTLAMKNNSYFMRREASQVALVRAWTYMQLVQNYGKVPFISKPVENAGTGWETNPAEGWATPENLLEKLEGVEGQSLTQAYAYAESLGYINYGNFKTGAGEYSHALMTFNADVVLGDLYLLRGASQADYEKAAYHFHHYLDKYNTRYIDDEATVSKFTFGDEDSYRVTGYAWGSNYTANSTNNIVTAVPSAANAFFGKVLTRVPQVYGFDPSSGVSSETSTGTDDDGNETTEVNTSGVVNVKANYKSRQVQPSSKYVALNENQLLIYNEFDPTEATKLIDVKYLTDGYADARLNQSAPLVRTEAGRLRFVNKFCYTTGSNDDVTSTSMFDFRYLLPVYTLRQVYLKYAEAVNRAGYPRHAFAILRDGLAPERLPEIGSEIVKSDTIFDKDVEGGAPEFEAEGYDCVNSVTNYYKAALDSANYINGGANCIDLNELTRAKDVAWLDFTDFTSKPNTGIHVAGCGYFPNLDSLYTYEKVVGQRIKDELLRSGEVISDDRAELGEAELGESKTTKGTIEVNGAKDYYNVTSNYASYKYYGPSEAEIAAVETLIADEMALDLAFEGTRYYDLMRIARHRTNAGLNGAAWLAWLISRRNLDLAPYEEANEVDSKLYDLLCNPDNWYLPAPKND